MNIPYHTRRTLKRVAIGLLAVLIVVLVVWVCWLIWLGRFVSYSRDEGAILDFNLPSQEQGELAVPPERETVSIFYNENKVEADAKKELTQIVGCYVQAEDLKDIPAVKKQIQSLPRGTAVMVDVKNIHGSFYYSSEVSSKRSDKVNTQEMDELIHYLKDSGMYAIAKLPAFRDYAYGLDHVSDGLPTSGGYLWMDDDGCYWLNPSSEGTINHLVQIVNELKRLGFDEVVFHEFCFPSTDSIVFDGNRTAALITAAQNLVSTCATDRFAVSFMTNDVWTMPEGRSRVYVRGVEATEVDQWAEKLGISSPETRVVYLTDVHDTRFEKYCVLRPLTIPK